MSLTCAIFEFSVWFYDFFNICVPFSLSQFEAKFSNFVANIGNMDELFEVFRI